MALLFRMVLDLHIAAGTVALLTFWVPLVTRKGGPAHRVAGWIYVAAAGTVAATAVAACIRLLTDGQRGHGRAGVFLAYVGVFAGESAYLGVRALRIMRREGASPGALGIIPMLLLVIGGAALAVWGASQKKALFVLFALLGVLVGVGHLRLSRASSPPRRRWLLAHMDGMGVSCITTVTAFVVVNAPRFGARRFDLAFWATPIVVLGAALAVWRRYYARNLARLSSPP